MLAAVLCMCALARPLAVSGGDGRIVPLSPLRLGAGWHSLLEDLGVSDVRIQRHDWLLKVDDICVERKEM